MLQKSIQTPLCGLQVFNIIKPKLLYNLASQPIIQKNNPKSNAITKKYLSKYPQKQPK